MTHRQKSTKFYEVMKITPVVVEDVLSMLLTIPLIDKSLQMNIVAR